MFLKKGNSLTWRGSIVLGKEKTRLLFDLSVTRGSFLSADTVFETGDTYICLQFYTSHMC